MTTGKTPENAAAAIAVKERSEDQSAPENERTSPAFFSGAACLSVLIAEKRMHESTEPRFRPNGERISRTQPPAA